MKKTHLSVLAGGLVLICAAAGLLRFPREISQAVTQALDLCFYTLLPCLFPFFVLSSLLVRSGLADLVGRLFSPLMRPLFRLPGQASCALVLGLIGGYPTGARTAAMLYQCGACTKSETEQLLSFCCNCSPAFLMGAVGCGVFGDARWGVLLLAVHWAGAILTGVILRGQSSSVPGVAVSAPPHRGQSLSAVFVESVIGSFRTLLDLFSFVLCFSAVNTLLEQFGAIEALSGLLFPFLSGSNGTLFLSGLLEMTGAVTTLPDGTVQEGLILAAALMAWGGLSIHVQILSILTEHGLSPRTYLRGKAVHAAVCALLMAFALYGLNWLCAAAGLLSILLPGRIGKKRSGKPTESIV